MTEMKHELHLNASPEAVWQELTKQALGLENSFRLLVGAGADAAKPAEGDGTGAEARSRSNGLRPNFMNSTGVRKLSRTVALISPPMILEA